MVSWSSPILLPLRYLKSLSGIPPDRFATVEAQCCWITFGVGYCRWYCRWRSNWWCGDVEWLGWEGGGVVFAAERGGLLLWVGLVEDWGKIWRGILCGPGAGRMSVFLLDGMLVNILNLDSLWEYVQGERAWHWHLGSWNLCAMCPFPISIQTISSWELQLMGHGGDET